MSVELHTITNFMSTHGQLHKSQRKTIAALTWAVLEKTQLGVATIGHALAMAHTASPKHAIRRVERFVSNVRLALETAQRDLISVVLAGTPAALVTLDWTDPHDGVHQILALNLRAHGRALPLTWITVRKDHLKGHMREYEIGLIQRTARIMPAGCRVLLLADRGFAATELFRALDAVGWLWVIRTKGSIGVRHRGRWMPLWSLAKSRPVCTELSKVLYGREATGGPYPCRIIIYADKGHRDPWYLVVPLTVSVAEWPRDRIIRAYGQRFTTEECFRDQKNDHYDGFHMDCVRLTTPERWDRLLLIFAWAYYWLNVGGWVMEQWGRDRAWQSNTRRTQRAYALWRLGEWGLKHHDLVWRTLLRARRAFIASIPSIASAPWEPTVPAA